MSGVVQRYRCSCCGCGFSAQTFHIDYFAKRRVDYARLLDELSSCTAVRAAGRLFGVDHKTVLNKLMRFARQALAAQAQVWDELALREDLVTDGFQSFWVSKYFPCDLHLLAGADSQFVYAANGVTIRRSGRMSAYQKHRREALERRYRADPEGVYRSFGELLELATAFIATATGKSPVALRSDEHEAYRCAVAAHGAFAELCARGRAVHRTTPSSAPRTRNNPLFAVNYLDRELRKDLAEHVRSSTRFGRSVHGAFDRLVSYLYWHNFRKRYRINTPRTEPWYSHAVMAGISEKLCAQIGSWIFRQRAFGSRSALRGPLLWQWLRMHRTPLQRGPPYLPHFLQW